MSPVEFDARETAIVILGGLATYVVFLSLLTLRFITNYDGFCLGLALTALGAFAARHTLFRDPSLSYLGSFLSACRRMPLTTRIPSALMLFLIALVFDRFLDGDPAHYRLATFILPIIVGVIVFDMKSAIGVILASALAIDYFMIPPVNAFALTTLSDALDLLVYVGVCAQIAVAVERFMTSDGSPLHG